MCYRIHATCMHGIVVRKREEKGFGFTIIDTDTRCSMRVVWANVP